MKKIKTILLILLTLFTFTPNVKAASLSIWASATNITVGKTVTISVNAKDMGGTFNITSSNNAVLSGGASGQWLESDTYTFNFTAKSVGKATITVTPIDVATTDEQVFTTSKSVTLNVVAKQTTNNNSAQGGTTSNKKEYSTDNSLKSLSVEGYDLEPGFDKDKTEYRLTVDQSIEKIKIIATKNHDKASISGDGEVNLSLGENTIDIKVTAENGNEKVYKIIVSVSDLHPIKVKIGESEYTVVKKNNDLIEKLEYYEETNIKIDDQDVVAYKNDKTKTTLVLLKDKDNNIKYYIYDEKTKKYEPYKYIKVNNIILQLLEPKEKLKNYKEYKTKINEVVLKIFKLEKGEKLGLVYGRNIATNNISFYQYDELENTLSRYYRKEIDFYKLETEKLKKYLNLGICIASGLFVVIILVSIIKSNKKKKLR